MRNQAGKFLAAVAHSMLILITTPTAIISAPPAQTNMTAAVMLTQLAWSSRSRCQKSCRRYLYLCNWHGLLDAKNTAKYLCTYRTGMF